MLRLHDGNDQGWLCLLCLHEQYAGVLQLLMDGRPARRRFLRVMASGTAAAALGDWPSAADDRLAPLSARTADVAIVGAGLAGLTAARELRKRDVKVCVPRGANRASADVRSTTPLVADMSSKGAGSGWGRDTPA